MAEEGAMAPQHPNGLLASLTAADFEVLRPHLEKMEMVQGTVLIEAGERMERVYFPHSGMISLVVPLGGGEVIEAAMIGRDSIVGGSSALDGKIALNKAIVQMPGIASALGLQHLQDIARTSEACRTTLLRHDQMILVQAQQSAACNIAHPAEQRLARWLLRCRDLTSSDELFLTQEFLGQMLGVGRPTMSIVAGTLQRAGLIRYHPRHIVIEDPQALQEAACECYAVVKSQSDRLLGTPADGLS
jgi:CRP-like cAMP-binding protein